MEELPPSEKNALLRAQGLNPQKLRYLALPLDFNYARFEAENHLDTTPSTVVLEYTGTQQPRLWVPGE